MTARAKAFNKRLSADSSETLEQRIVTAYSLAFGRIPTEAETTEAIRFLQTNSGKSDDAFVDFCHVLLNSSEFLYVD
jgi:aconitase B